MLRLAIQSKGRLSEETSEMLQLNKYYRITCNDAK